ncbi:MAG: methyltransferase domain-containing protein [Phycisphaerae bacterium]|nr:methyltransferase domain-containing protein [Phycisphaerae bacterium]
MTCPGCGGGPCRLALERPAPGLTSMATLLPVPTRVFACDACGLLHSPALPDTSDYYANTYDTTSGAGDDLMGVDEAGRPIYRLQRQAEVIAARVAGVARGRLLDFGCGHGAFMRAFAAARPGWRVEGAEVSDRYAAPDVTVGALPAGPFDLITALYVFEHLEQPAEVATQLARRLAPGGRLLLTVPNPVANPVDLLAVDHRSHFTPSSLERVLTRSGLQMDTCDDDTLPATWLAHATATATPHATPSLRDDRDAARRLPAYWTDVDRTLEAFLTSTPDAPGSLAIYGAGVWGLCLRTHPAFRAETLACFIDRNPRKQGTSLHGAPVVGPESIPASVNAVLIGVRPESVPAVESLPALAPYRRFTLPPWRTPCEA